MIPVFGSAGDPATNSRGWFIGHFMPGEDNPLCTSDVEMKWFTHAKGERGSLKRILSGALAFVALLIPGIANAMPSCDAVRQVLAAADARFAGMIGRQRYRNIYEGSFIVPGFTECSVDFADYPNGLAGMPPGRAVEYGCVVHFDAPVPARDFQTSLIAEMQSCLSLPPEHDRGGASFMLSDVPDNRRLRVSMFESGSTEYAVRLALTHYETGAAN